MEYVYRTRFPEPVESFLPERSPPKILLTRNIGDYPAPVPRKGEMVRIGGVKRMVEEITHSPEENRVYIELGSVVRKRK